MNDDIMTLQDVAEYLKISVRTAYGYAQKGILPAFKVGTAWRFRKTDLDVWVEAQRRLTEQSTSQRMGKKEEEKA